MNNFKVFQGNPVYKSGDVVAVVCQRHDDFINWINEKRRLSNNIEVSNLRFDTIDNVRYLSVSRPHRTCGYRINHIIILDNAEESPFYEEIMRNIQPCLVNEGF